MKIWLLEDTVRKIIEEAHANAPVISLDQQATYAAGYYSDSGDMSARVLTVAGDQAEIRVEGVITKAPDYIAYLFGGGNTTYAEIVSALATADADPNIQQITLAFDSPGGSVDGLFDAIAAIRNTETPTRALVTNQASSAAYGLAAQCDTIVAGNAAAQVGSVGVMAKFTIFEDVVTVTSTEAPNKAPDASTEEGRTVIRRQLDAMHALFVDEIAAGRNTTASNVNTTYGRGEVLLAGQALTVGMIDSIESANLTVVPTATSPDTEDDIEETATASSGDNLEGPVMDLNTLKAQHQAVYAAAVAEGVTQERERCQAHAKMGEAYGAADVALKAIAEGSDLGPLQVAAYTTAQQGKTDIADNIADDAGSVAAAANGATPPAADGDTSAQVVALVEQQVGVGDGATQNMHGVTVV